MKFLKMVCGLLPLGLLAALPAEGALMGFLIGLAVISVCGGLMCLAIDVMARRERGDADRRS